jgi:hypothetical protein
VAAVKRQKAMFDLALWILLQWWTIRGLSSPAIRPGVLRLAIILVIRVGLQHFVWLFTPLPATTWFIACLQIELLIVLVGFPPIITMEKMIEQDNAICYERSTTNMALKLVNVVFFLCFIAVFLTFHRKLWTTDRRWCYMTFTPYFAVPSFMYSMSLFYPYLESGAAWFGLDITNQYFYLVARNAYPIYMALAVWAAWLLTSHMKVPATTPGDERVDLEYGAVKKSVSVL